MSEGGSLVSDSGASFQPLRSHPMKVDRNGHRWIVIITYTLSRSEAETMIENAPIHLDAENFHDVTKIVCYSCELPFDFSSEHPCPGEPKGYHPSGLPIHHQRWIRDGYKEKGWS